MPISYSFKCKQCSHEFTAVAKIRSKCPECGSVVFRTPSMSLKTTISTLNPGDTITPSSIPTSTKVEKEEPTDTGSLLPTSLKPSKSEPVKSVSSTKPSARIVRAGKVPIAKKPIKVASVVKRHVAPKHSVPTIGKMPEGSRQHKIDDRGPTNYFTTMRDTYFRRAK